MFLCNLTGYGAGKKFLDKRSIPEEHVNGKILENNMFNDFYLIGHCVVHCVNNI